MQYSFSAVCFDLDGTLLNSQKKLTDEIKVAVDKLKEKGIQILIATGRDYPEIIGYINELGLVNSYFICSDGLYIYDSNGKIIYTGDYICKEKAIEAFTTLNCSTAAVIAEDQTYFLTKKRIKFLRQLKSKLLKQSTVFIDINDLRNIKDIQIKKIIGSSANADKLDNGSSCYHVFSNYTVEILSKNVNKYIALKWLSVNKCVDLNTLLFFGDDANDIECFSNLSYSVTMNSAPTIIKDKAAFITENCDLNGVSIALQKYDLI